MNRVDRLELVLVRIGGHRIESDLETRLRKGHRRVGLDRQSNGRVAVEMYAGRRRQGEHGLSLFARGDGVPGDLDLHGEIDRLGLRRGGVHGQDRREHAQRRHRPSNGVQERRHHASSPKQG
jgi:hypothetical protein